MTTPQHGRPEAPSPAVREATVRPGQRPKEWRRDLLGAGFQAVDIELGADPQGEGDVRATVVRYLPDPANPPAGFEGRTAVVWVHGMTDYFFQEHVARRLHAEGYAFYAVDLRKCGRAHRPGQSWHDARDMADYEPDLDAAAALLLGRHPRVVPLAHSTGGLIVPLWLRSLKRREPALAARVAGLVLNSPWLDLQFSEPTRSAARALAKGAGRLKPGLVLPMKESSCYADTLHVSRHGEWDYALELKPPGGAAKRAGWLRAVIAGQDRVREGLGLDVPILTLCSERSILRRPYSADSHEADTVLDVEQITAAAPKLGPHSAIRRIPGALHDVFLSREPAREEALEATLRFLARLGEEPLGDQRRRSPCRPRRGPARIASRRYALGAPSLGGHRARPLNPAGAAPNAPHAEPRAAGWDFH